MKRTYVIGILLIMIICCTPIYAQYKSVESHGLAIGYRIFGEGKPLLIIGGGPGDVSDRYLSLCELLAKNYQCILVDQRGTGKSAPEVMDSTNISVSLTLDDFEAIRKELGFDQWNVLGFSYGGLIASLYAHNFSSTVSSLILLNSVGLNRNNDSFRYFQDNITSRLRASDVAVVEYWLDSARLAQDFQHAITEMIRAKMPGYFYDRQKSLLVSEIIKDSDFDFEMGQWIWKDVIENDMDLTKVKSNFKNQVLIVQGRQDPLGESIPQELKGYYDGSKLIFVEKAGHYSWIEQPDTVLKEIVDFLE